MKITEKYLDPFTDFGFKKIFGSEPHKDLLISFLNSLLEGYKHINNLEYAKNEQLGRQNNDRKAHFDLYCTGSNGEHFIIELQRLKQLYFKDRCLYYVTFPIQNQAPRNQHWDYRLNEVILIGLMEFITEDINTSHYRRDIQLIDQTTGKVFYDKLKFIYLEIPRFTKTAKELETNLDKWMFLLKNLHKFQEIPEILREKIFRKVFNIAEVAQLNKKDMSQYEQSLKEKWDWYSCMETARDEGREEGEEKGMEKVARNLKAKGASFAYIAEVTGLTEEVIREL